MNKQSSIFAIVFLLVFALSVVVALLTPSPVFISVLFGAMVLRGVFGDKNNWPIRLLILLSATGGVYLLARYGMSQWWNWIVIFYIPAVIAWVAYKTPSDTAI